MQHLSIAPRTRICSTPCMDRLGLKGHAEPLLPPLRHGGTPAIQPILLAIYSERNCHFFFGSQKKQTKGGYTLDGQIMLHESYLHDIDFCPEVCLKIVRGNSRQ